MNAMYPRSVRAQAASTSASLNFAAGDYEFAHWLSNIGAGPQSLYAGAYSLEANDGTRRLAYCLDFNSDFDTERSYSGGPITRDGVTSASWIDGADELARAKTHNAITWIARHTFPAVSLDELARVTDTPGLTREEAIAATQTAIWTLSNALVFAGLVDADFVSTKRVLRVIDYFLGAQQSAQLDPAGTVTEITAGAMVRLSSAQPQQAEQPEPSGYFLVLSGIDREASTTFAFDDDLHSQAVA
ncbi:thioester domain-containing protein [Gulosibacter chungangensis]|uniref:TQXA domain-containing protein n=1 Tax=Gulosibacter chungangensis TaxID=979746 RepID=A0A7J5BAE6_9MICO|nr:thioester domain-containing protein [Gulosibacter chungangensis]KAB1641195.1 TQXA domain-containing protein [Gulosibacter chungangensis]